MRQWTAIHLAKLARKASRAVGKRGTDLPGQIARKVDTDILRKLAEQVDDIYLSVEQMVKQRLQT
ncbi:UDP-N-acetylmuramoylalanyl-D-glutamate--2, 6-diaminopimelate ligase [Staphylococcus aureus]|uniref:UDP-N-acetylmuramoylalanyl-D-glutamate--2, 6-diaminopimelate ligase n=1 Tax=Staphylococcus aureus TaxID=1280 RepID=A0A2X2K4I2_STAAU|nr:UDP-N-acetylmuramoylalanyl-D-glutamate--2, 6-diaminopimelate ligase [Staphylococcus aureus]